MKEHSIEELNRLYKEAEEADSDLFAEQRSNLLLVSGNHYSKKTSQFFSRVRNSAKISNDTKLRLTKNHVQKITKYYENAINSRVPGVTVAPQNDMDMQDKKSAQLNLAVWNDGKSRYNFKELFKEYVRNFVQIGEMCAFMYWDPNAGEVKGYSPTLDEMGQPIVDEMGQMQPDEEQPVFEGAFKFKNIPGFNLLRSPAAQSMKNSPYVIIREMVDLSELQEIYEGDEEKLKAVGSQADKDGFVVFDTNKNSYGTSGDQVLVKYIFFRPCKQYADGYFYVYTDRGMLEEGPLPFGIFPVIYEGFDVYATNPRGYSIIKVARPYQAEINRAASQAATHQITVGDDKIIYQGSAKLAPGALLPGVRGITYQGGMAPQILPGRDGGQFLPYIQSQISEMYSACMVEEIMADANLGQMDPYVLLYRSAGQKAKFGNYIEKVENFLKSFCMTYLDLARHYLPDDYVIQAVGKVEAVNMTEFKATGPLNFKIKIEEQDETAESRFGKQIVLNHVLQYVGNQMDQKQVGLVLKEMPFLNNNSLFKQMHIDYDNVENDMLALERGEPPPFISPYADNKVYIDAITYRMKCADYKLLTPQIQNNYKAYLKQHELQMKQKADAEQAAQAGFIPTGGAMITCSMHLPDPKNPGATQQVRLPYEALMFLIKRLESQGTGLEQLSGMNQGAVADIAGMLPGQGSPNQLPPPARPPVPA